MKKLIGFVLLLGICLALYVPALAAGSGFEAEADDASVMGIKASFLFMEDDNVLYKYEKDSISRGKQEITIYVPEGYTIKDVSADIGERYALEKLSSSSVVVTWGKAGPTASSVTFTITVISPQYFTVEHDEALKLLYKEMVTVDDGTEITDISINGEMMEREGTRFFCIQNRLDSEDGTLRIYYNNGKATHTCTLPLKEITTVESGGDLVLTVPDIYRIEIAEDGEATLLRMAEKGEALGYIPDPEVEEGTVFTGWQSGGIVYTEDTKINSDILLEPTFEAEYEEHEILISNAGNLLITAMEEALGEIDPLTVEVYLEGVQQLSGSWTDEGRYYRITAREAASGITGITLTGSGKSIRLGRSEFSLGYDGLLSLKIPEQAVESLLNMGSGVAYMQGRSQERFAPDAGITRAESAVIFYRCLTEAAKESMQDFRSYPDVEYTSWYVREVGALSGAGILSGRDGGLFEPNAGITRAEFVTVAMRLLKGEAYEGADLFSDISGSWARAEINRAAELGIISGYPDGTFRPEAGITRAEAAAVVNALLSRDAEHGFATDAPTFADVPTAAWYYTPIKFATSFFLAYEDLLH